MSDVSSVPETGEAEVTTESGEQAPKPTETVDFWKAKAREQEKRAKDNAEAARRLAEIEDTQKSAEDRAAEALKKQTERAESAESALLRFEVMAEKGVPAKARQLVAGKTRDEIEASCDAVLELISDAGLPRTPKPNPAQREGDSIADDKDAQARAFFGI